MIPNIDQVDPFQITLLSLITNAKKLSKGAMEEAARTDSVDSFPTETIDRLCIEKFLIAAIPARYGGYNLGIETNTNIALLEILYYIGRGNLVVGRVLEGHINAQLLINTFGSEAQIEYFSAEAKTGKLFGVWNTEANNGVKVRELEDGTYELQGSKTFGTAAGFISYPIVTAAFPNNAWQMCVVPLSERTVKFDDSFWKPIGMRASRSYRVNFSGIRLGSKFLLGEGGDYYQQPWFSGGAVRFAAIQLGGAEALFKETISYLQSLKRIDDPYQKMRIGQMAILSESGKQWIKGAGEMLDNFIRNPNEKTSENLLYFANMMRTATEQICIEMITLCTKCIGARGLNTPYHFERIIRDLTIYLRQPAPDASLSDIGDLLLKNGELY